jgi:hypothetical protein
MLIKTETGQSLTSLLVEAFLLFDGAPGSGNWFEALIGDRFIAFDREAIGAGGKPLLGVLYAASSARRSSVCLSSNSSS